MQNPIEVEMLMVRDKQKYGRTDGPSFEFLLEGLVDEGLTRDEAYEAVIKGAYRTNEGVNKALGF